MDRRWLVATTTCCLMANGVMFPSGHYVKQSQKGIICPVNVEWVSQGIIKKIRELGVCRCHHQSMIESLLSVAWYSSLILLVFM